MNSTQHTHALLPCDHDDALAASLSEALGGMPVLQVELDGIDDETAAGTEVIFGEMSRKLPPRCPQLKWIQYPYAGVWRPLLDAMPPHVILTCATGGYGHAVSEHMIGMTFELMKKLHLYRDEQLKGEWKPRGMVKSIEGATVTILGLGDIGSACARKMKALGAYIIGVRRTQQPKPDYVDELVISGDTLRESLATILPRTDALFMILPDTPATTGIIGAEELAMMKEDAIIINAGRGTAIDTDALCNALENKTLGGAALDVTDPEPLPAGHKLWRLENAVITPHVAGRRNMKETGEEVHALWLRNARHYRKGEPMESVVDRVTGYAYHASSQSSANC
jgi:phosphoglycerate dehydrogenase-like enzyme